MSWKYVGFLWSCVIISSSIAQTPPAEATKSIEECQRMTVRDDRLKCYDEVTKRTDPSTADKAKVPTSSSLYLRSSASANAFSKEAAMISWDRTDGKNSPNIKAALLWLVDTPFSDVAQPFVVASWLRRGTGSDADDMRKVGLGVVADVLDRKKFGVGITSTAQISVARDGVTGTNVRDMRLHNSVGVPTCLGVTFSCDPYFGVARTWEGNGNTSLVYAGFDASYAPTFLSERLSLDATGKLFRLRATGVNQSERYATFGIHFKLASKGDPFQPALFIEREIGFDALGSGKRVNSVTAGLRIKYN
ncbi:MAG TPA: hypothetical protein PK586_09140 [Casimicrobium sp.]|nr:hypothetical protein [Casimicrobium sp.]